jgi:hypothetical protein
MTAAGFSSAALLLGACTVLGASSAACTPDHKDTPGPHPLMKNGFPVGAPPVFVDAAAVVPHEDLPVILDASTVFITTITEKVSSTAAAKRDPDQDVIASARESAASCFNGIKNGPPTMTATIHVTVIPSGSVTRAEATASSSDPGVVSCLEGVGEGLRFSDKSDKRTADIRTYSIDVTVARNH